ncbi:probable protein phosphatase 2C 65 [Populus nigra]|uniref:probable protein phosphatase 2C 65 n=1 Tax=Populus nigra TaxID=3691 RepID=UPI002B269F7C|nr:probable protein phosphatase 2C 65 [Populus nigra]
MGACCSKEPYSDGVVEDAIEEKELEDEEEGDVIVGDYGARLRLYGPSKYTSMYTQQGRKGINQDAMTVWEEFTGDKDMLFCGVFDGHGPYGHKVARHIRDTLPSRLSREIKTSQNNSFKSRDADGKGDNSDEVNKNKGGKDSVDDDDSSSLLLSSWEATFTKSFKEMDEELSLDASIDSFCSGTTAVTIVKEGNNLIIANLGDSRAVLCSKGPKNQLIPIQLTVDLKPNIASEAERVKNSNGRVFALEKEPELFRIWMPDEDCPGLAMARAFGDFCLKDYGLISTPEVSYRRVTDKDEFVILATDGVWDVLTNYEVIKIVASARKRSMAAKLVVKHAARAWRSKFPGSKVDDSAVICLFLKNRTLLTRSFSEVTQLSVNHSELEGYSDMSLAKFETYSEVSRASLNHSEIAAVPERFRSKKREGSSENADTDFNSEEYEFPHFRLQKVNSSGKFPRLRKVLSRRKSTRAYKGVETVEV